MACSYELREEYLCTESEVFGFDYCPDHLATPRGLLHAQERIKNGPLFTVKDMEKYVEEQTKGPDVDYHTSALEKMEDSLSKVISWREECEKRLRTIDESKWRFTDRAGAEQVRTEYTAYERAMDRETKVLERVSKMALSEKIVSLGRAQTELVIRLVMTTVERLGVDAVQYAKAREILLEEFNREANLSGRVKAEVTAELEPVRATAEQM